MKFMPMRTLTRETQSVLSNLQRDGELVVTNNGQPCILMIDLVNQDLVDVVNNFRHFRYISEKLDEVDQRAANPDAEWLEHGEFWSRARAL